MDTFFTRNMMVEPMSEDIFGASFAGREIIYDYQNKDLFLKMLANYYEWHNKNGTFHPTYKKDYEKL